MSACLWLVATILVGGALQLGGVGLVAVEIARDRQKASELYRRSARARISGHTSASAFGQVTAVGGREPTTDERVERLEARVETLSREQAEAKERLRGEMRDAVAAEAGQLREEIGKQGEELRRFLEHVLTGSLRGRRAGVIMFALGIGLSTVGAVWALWSGC